MDGTLNKGKAIAAQMIFCSKHNLPMFAPSNGICWRCGRNIYEGERGVSVERAGAMLITGCPYCHRTYVD